MQLPDEHIQELLEAIDRTGRVFAKAKAQTTAMEEHRKITKATLMKFARMDGAKSRESSEAEAYTSPQYKLVSDKLVKAIEDEVIASTENQNAIREWESWRTLCANERNITR